MPSKNKGPVVPGGASAPNNPNQFKNKKNPMDDAVARYQQQQEDQRRYDSSSYTPQGKSLIDSWMESFNKAQTQKLEDQRRYDSSGLGTTGTPAPVTNLGSQLQDRYSTSAGGSQSTGSSGGSGYGSSGGGSVPVTPEMTLEQQLAAIQGLTGTIDPSLRSLVPTTGELEVMYGKLTGEFDKQKAALNADYEAAMNAVRQNYGQSNNLVQQAISGDQNTLAQAAASFGITPEQWQGGPTAQSQTESLNRILGQNTSDQAVDLAWFEKMQGMDTSQFNDWANLAAFQKQGAIEGANETMLQLQQMANEQARTQAMNDLLTQLGLSGGGSGGSSGGGGGGGYGGYGGSGGSSSSSDAYKTLGQSAEEAAKQLNVGVAELISGIGDPVLRDWVTQQWVGNNNSVTRMLDDLYGERNAASIGQTLSGYQPGVDAFNRALGWAGINLDDLPSNTKFDAQTIQALIEGFMQFDPTLGLNTQRDISTTSTQKGKVPSVPIEQVLAGGSSAPPKPKAGTGNSKNALKNSIKPKPKKPSNAAKNSIAKFF